MIIIKEKKIQGDLQCAFTVANPKTNQLQALMVVKITLILNIIVQYMLLDK